MEKQLSKPKGLLSRGNSYFFQARIPKQYRKHYPTGVIREKLPTDSYTEAVRLVHSRWASLHEEFKVLDSSAVITKPLQTSSSITLEAMQNVVSQMVHSKISEDGAMRSRGYHADPTYKARVLSKLSKDEEIVTEAISKGNYEGLITPAKNWLRGNGYNLELESSEFRTFAELFAEGMARVNTAIRERDKGIVINEPMPPEPIKHKARDSSDTYEALKSYWISQATTPLSRTALAEANTIIAKFKSMVGDIRPSEVTRHHVILLKDKMLEAKSAPATINKGRGILAAIFNTAYKNLKIESNPFFGMEKLAVPRGEVEKPYNLEELNTIFNSPIYTQGERPKRFKGEAAYWIPLLALYSGARLNELGQIFTEDVGVEDGIDYFIIKADAKTNRTVKDSNSRKVPIHPDIIKMGFLEYVSKIKLEGHQQLFPELKVTRVNGKLADKWGSWWRSYVREELGITRVPQPTHGFRHTFIDHARRSKVDTELRRIIEGHAPTTVELKAYKGLYYPLEPLYEELTKLHYRGLDLTHLKAKEQF